MHESYWAGMVMTGKRPFSPVVAIRVPWGRIAVRAAGNWIAAVGLLLLGWSLRPT